MFLTLLEKISGSVADYMNTRQELFVLATRYNQIGNQCYQNKEYQEAIDNFEQSLTLWFEFYGKNSTNNHIAKLYSNLAAVYLKTGDAEYYDKAIGYCEMSLLIWHKHSNKSEIAKCYDNLAIIHHAKGSYDEAIKFHLKSLKLYSKIHKDDLVDFKIAATYYKLAVVYKDNENYALSIKAAEEAAKIYGNYYPDMQGKFKLAEDLVTEINSKLGNKLESTIVENSGKNGEEDHSPLTEEEMANGVEVDIVG